MAVAAMTTARISLLRGGNDNVVDDFCDSVGAVAGRIGFELHDGWLHSPVARAGAYRAYHQPGDRPTNGLELVQRPLCDSDRIIIAHIAIDGKQIGQPRHSLNLNVVPITLM